MLHPCKVAIVCAALLLLSGCAAWQVNQLAQQLPHTGPAQTLSKLEALSSPNRDRVQQQLNTGLLKLYTGDFGGCREDLQQAKESMANLEATSITENLAAVTTNETLRSYTGTATDQVLVHVALELCYLFADDLDGARVEALQADVTMRKFEGDNAYGHLAAARFLGGVIFELAGERDDALISYRKAYEILTERQQPIPPALQLSLLNLTRSQGFKEEYAGYQQQFDRSAELPKSGQGSWLMIYFNGVVSQKTQSHLSVFNNDLNTLITVVLPHYPPIQAQSAQLNWQLGDSAEPLAAIENIEQRVRQDLEHDYAATLAAATARAVVKYHLVKDARGQSDLAAALTNIATVASEQADVRSWNMLPAAIQIGRATAALNSEVSLPDKSFHYRRADGTPGDFVVLFAYSYSPDVFSYP